MDQQRREHMERIMDRLAGGDPAALVALLEDFGPELRAVARSIAARQGATALDHDDVDGLVVEIGLVLLDRAAAWRPDGGALPWRWAAGRLNARVAEVIGQHTRPLDGHRGEIAGVSAGPAHIGPDGPPVVALERLAELDEHCALVLRALDTAVSRRDADVWLRYRQQQLGGDPSPARTVAGEVGLRPDAVRQIVRRSRAKVARLVTADPRFGPLAGLALLAPPTRRDDVA